ncbi:hypothetical protein RHABOEDO_001329 [Candidatus Rhabdochlamydia oedothoracis]|uniref:Transposase DDE domain-containing protein n=1 Tax=Candidatus Rhabdochlamydia oedothoracis TaxID=2720720 RepID=A0ABX8V1E4_9BACT|nr:hypothetical protein RHOW815_001386 [Candidatus Rhabdochlamydia sp. W815]QYF49067.1 hypothetical protein RHABOEDO_001329 [Candidatus Rhabdochlamydia oedothoracis]
MPLRAKSYHITTANITDRNGCIEAFSLHKNHLFGVKNVLADERKLHTSPNMVLLAFIALILKRF